MGSRNSGGGVDQLLLGVRRRAVQRKVNAYGGQYRRQYEQRPARAALAGLAVVFVRHVRLRRACRF